jgi:hypothetical protein
MRIEKGRWMKSGDGRGKERESWVKIEWMIVRESQKNNDVSEIR